MGSRSVTQFQKRLNQLIGYFRTEYKLSLAEAMGTLEIVKLDLYEEQKQAVGDEPNEPQPDSEG